MGHSTFGVTCTRPISVGPSCRRVVTTGRAGLGSATIRPVVYATRLGHRAFSVTSSRPVPRRPGSSATGYCSCLRSATVCTVVYTARLAGGRLAGSSTSARCVTPRARVPGGTGAVLVTAGYTARRVSRAIRVSGSASLRGCRFRAGASTGPVACFPGGAVTGYRARLFTATCATRLFCGWFSRSGTSTGRIIPVARTPGGIAIITGCRTGSVSGTVGITTSASLC